MKLYSIVFTIVATLGFLGAPVVTQADAVKGDAKNYSGLGCREVPDGVVIPKNPTMTGEDDVRYNSAGWAYNASTTHSIVVACPIVREHTDKPMKRAWVVVRNRTKEKVVCQIEAFDKNGLYHDESSDFVYPNNFISQTVFISNDKDDTDYGPEIYDNSNLVTTLTNKEGYYVLLCYLPAATPELGNDGAPTGNASNYAFVVRYRIDEAYN